ncbi:MAG: glycosyltransferase family 1 protein [Calditrichaeota bacterium]|nr:MAG: glycosyltransferase family 1 protein [Calditrichota bacterium]
MKFFILTEDYPPAPGGIAQWARGVAHSLARLKHDVTVITRIKPGATLTDDSVLRMVALPVWQWINLRLLYLYAATYWQIIKHRPDVIIATTWNLAAIALKGRSWFGYRVVTVYHGLEVTKNLTARHKRLLLRVLDRSALNIAVSRFTRDRICEKLSLPADTIQVVPNGVNLELFYPAPPRVDLQEKYQLRGRRVLLTLSRVIGRKGHDIVIRALPALVEKYPNLLYLIAGAWHQDFYERLQALIREKDMADYVRFTGRLEDDALPDVYNLAEIYIMVSKGSGESGNSEGFGITYLEANACEKPVIGSNVDGIPDAIEDGVNGLLVEANNVDVTRRAIERLLHDADLRDKLGRAGRSRIERQFTWEKVTGRILNLLENHNE